MKTSTSSDSPPLPPDHLIARVTPSQGREITEADRLMFDASGRQSAQELNRSVASVGRELREFDRILDFGCGCGRVTRWLRPLADDSELQGCDIDEFAIAWDQEHLTFAKFSHTPTEPPLPYVSGYFDLVLNHSVFTHLDEYYQDMWLEELCRIVSPGGFLVLSVHGEHAFSLAEGALQGGGEDPGAWRSTLERDGILFIKDDTYVGGLFPDFYHTTFHAPWYVFSHWSKWFDVMSYLPRADLGHQDVVVLQRRLDDRVPNAAVQPAIDRTYGEVAAPQSTDVRSPIETRIHHAIARLVGAIKGQLTKSADSPSEDEDSVQRIPTVVRLILDEHGERLRRLEEGALAADRARE